MSARPVLISLLLICLIAVGIVILVILGMRSIRQDSSSTLSLRVWRDENTDLLIETPLYKWNITSGETVSILVDEVWQEWRSDTQGAGDRVIDTLFLSPELSGTLRGRVMFSLGDRTVVYLERDARAGVEALELAFRANDGVVRVTHAWLGDEMPADVRQASRRLPNLEGRFVQEMMDGLSAEERVHLAANYSFLIRFEPGLGEQYRLDLGEKEDRRIGPARPACSSDDDLPPDDAWARDRSNGEDSDPCRFVGFFVPGQILGSEYVAFFSTDPTAILQPVETGREPVQLDSPDLDAAYIERTPRYSYRAAKKGPDPGDSVIFAAHVANTGSHPTGAFDYVWSIDNVLVLSDTHPGLEPGDSVTLPLEWIWQTGAHTVTLHLDPDDTLAEMSEQNNVVKDRTDALSVGFWVEQSVYDYFHAHQIERGLGSVSWEDWAQRQLRILNQMFADAIYPLTPSGILERVRLDMVTVVPDGALPPCATHYPDVSDGTVDLQWGFPAELVGINTGHTCGQLDFYFSQPDAQDIEYTLLHELSHARYLVDLYGLNVHVGHLTLSSAIDTIDSTLVVAQNVGVDPSFPVPAHLAIAGELVVCQSKTESAFVECERGAEGTTPRSHGSGTPVHLAVIRLQDGRGNLVQGSTGLPVSGDLLYRHNYPDDLMSGGTAFQQHSAYAWNRIAGRRPCCGNFHAPSNLGEYLNDLPAENRVGIKGSDGQPLPGVQIQVYRAKPLPVWYGKVYQDPPDAVHVTDPNGRVGLGPNPFTGGPNIVHEFGHSNTVVLLGISTAQQTVYRFFDITVVNEAYWSGQVEEATYVITMPE